MYILLNNTVNKFLVYMNSIPFFVHDLRENSQSAGLRLRCLVLVPASRFNRVLMPSEAEIARFCSKHESSKWLLHNMAYSKDSIPVDVCTQISPKLRVSLAPYSRLENCGLTLLLCIGRSYNSRYLVRQQHNTFHREDEILLCSPCFLA